MLKPFRFPFACCLLLASAAPSFAVEATDGPFDALQSAYAPYMSTTDPLAFPLKVYSLKTDPYTFWRGSKDLFFAWCKTNTADWLADRESYVPSHGDLHLGNIGTYAKEGTFGELGFGMVDFDDSATLPFQIELLQGVITLRLVAEQNGIKLDDAQRARIDSALFESYRRSLGSERSALAQLRGDQDPLVERMLRRKDRSYVKDELGTYLDDSGERFRSRVRSSKGKLREILAPAEPGRDAIAKAICQAIKNSPDAATLFRDTSEVFIKTSIKAIAQRTRLGSSGSQGLRKFLVLLATPFRSVDHDVIVYLKEEIPSAAERQGVIARVENSPGQRVADDLERLAEPRPYLNSWCELDGRTYWFSLKEPWSDELDPSDVHTENDLLRTARVWGTVAGAPHGEDGRFRKIVPKLSQQLFAQIVARAQLFFTKLHEDYGSFVNDRRVSVFSAIAERALRAATDESNASVSTP